MILSLKSEGDVTDENLRTLDKLVSSNNTILLNHASWCGHCHHFQRSASPLGRAARSAGTMRRC